MEIICSLNDRKIGGVWRSLVDYLNDCKVRAVWRSFVH